MGKYKGFSGAGMNNKQKMGGALNQVKKMQEEMQKLQAEIEEKEVKATVGGGVVEVVANGKKEIVSIKISPEAVDPDDVETLEDLVMAAVNEVIKKAEAMMEEGMGQITSGLNIPGLF